METALIAGGVVLILALVILAVVVDLAKDRGRAEADVKAATKTEDLRRRADNVLAEPVADEQAWIELQIRMAEKVAAARGTSAARERLRDLQRRTGRGPGPPNQ